MSYIKVFAGLALYYDLIPRALVSEDDLKGNLKDENANAIRPLFSGNLKDIKVSTLHLMQHFDDGCKANCAYCVQARDSVHDQKKSLLVDKEVVRIPYRTLQTFLKNSPRVEEIERICIQTVFNKNTVSHLLQTIQAIREVSDIPISACCIPVPGDELTSIRNAGADRITINFETATPALFSSIRGKKRGGPYRWEVVEKALADSLEIFGSDHVTTHLQIGLGETQEEALWHIQNMVNKGILVGLFAFCPIAGTAMADAKRIEHKYFHQIQLAKYLITDGSAEIREMKFDETGNIVNYGVDEKIRTEAVMSGLPFQLTGCPGCNRVFYETNPGERFYSYPRSLYKDEIDLIAQELLGN